MAGKPTFIQIRVATALEIDVAGDSLGVAAARIHDAVAEAIAERHGARPATPRQIEFAATLSLDVSSDTVRVASARIADELDRCNRDALVSLNLQAGDRVVIRKRYEIDGRHHAWIHEFTISSIDSSGRLHFKGGNGAGAWPTEVEKLAAGTSS